MSWVNEQNLEHIRRYENTFWGNITVIGDDEDECWNWNKSISKSGYGTMRIGIGKGKQVSLNSHRYAWLLLKGLIPEGLFCLHICDNRRCCNPNHLFIGTPSDNMQDMYRKGRSGIDQWRGKTHTEEARNNMKKAWERRQRSGISNS